jgi:hypothetical protein
MTNSDIAAHLAEKYARIQALRDARRAEMQAVIRKCSSEVRLTYQLELAKRRKIPDRP